MSKARPLQRAAGGLGPRPSAPSSAKFQPYERDVKQQQQQLQQQQQQLQRGEKTVRGKGVVVVQSVWDLPIGSGERGCGEHQARNMHRPLHPGFVSSRQMWVGSLDSAAARPYFTPRKGTTTLEKPPVCEGDVNVRALLVTGISPDESLHILRRVTCVFSKFEQHIGAYGGPTSHTDRDGQQKALTDIVRSQCGVTVSSWTPLVELLYGDGKRTVFYIPCGLQGDVYFSPSEGMCPTVGSFVDLLDCKIECTAHNKDLWELLTASDAFDEYLKRDMMERVRMMLLGNKQKMQDAEEASADHEETVRKEHARREQDVVDRLAACKQREKRLRESWVAEDEGKTDRQKQKLNDIRAFEIEKLSVEAKSIQICEEQIEEELHDATLCENNPALVSFQFFDRPKGVGCGTGSISRARLGNLLLSLSRPELNTQRKVDSLIDSALPLGTRIPYPSVCTDITRR